MKQNGKFIAGCILSLFLLLAMASFSPMVSASPVGDGVKIQGYGPGDGTGNGGDGPKDGSGYGPGDCSL